MLLKKLRAWNDIKKLSANESWQCKMKRCHCIESFPDGSVVKNSPANPGDVGSISGSGRHLEKKKKATHSSILAWEIHGQRIPAGYSPRGHKNVRHDLVTKQQQHCIEHRGPFRDILIITPVPSLQGK